MDLLEFKTSNSIEYNSILILIDYFIKQVYYYLVRKIINATQLTEVANIANRTFLIRQFGLPPISRTTSAA